MIACSRLKGIDGQLDIWSNANCPWDEAYQYEPELAEAFLATHPERSIEGLNTARG